MDLSSIKVGFLGAGHFAYSLIKAFLDAGALKSQQLACSNRSVDNLEKIKELGVDTVTTKHDEMVRQCDIIMIAVHPTAVVDVLKEVAKCTNERKLVVSVAAGAKIAAMEEVLPHNFKVVRLLPNLQSMVCAGAAFLAPGSRATDSDIDTAQRLFSTIGICHVGKEADIDIVSVLIVPLFGYLAIESMADGAVRMGLPREVATQLAAQNMLGAAKLVLESGKRTGELKEEVCSPGGVTSNTLHALEQGNFRATIMNAVEKGTVHARGMAKK